MKQRYVISKQSGGEEITVSEHAEVEKDIYSLLCEETFNYSEIAKAAESGEDALIQALRTENLYPPLDYSQKIAETVAQLMADDDIQTAEVSIDDKKVFLENQEALEEEVLDDIDDEDDDAVDEIAEILDGDTDAKPIVSTIKKKDAGSEEDN